MRNLTLISSWASHISPANVSATTFDLDENVLYVSSECYNLDGEVEVELWKIDQSEGLNKPPADPESVANFRTVASSNGLGASQVVSLRFIAETRQIVAIMRGGDVIVVSAEELNAPFEIEGTFDSGILAASWNPDESVVAIVTGEHKLLLLTSTFDVLSEGPLYSQEFGEDAPINVGWGSKQTQFHGSLGKAAAQATPKIKVGTSPDDDSLPRISWRGDGTYFVVSSVSPDNSPDSEPHRTLRIYDRQGTLQSTSEEVAGLEHTLVWRPSGNLIVGTQRFGFEGGGTGREGRHDVIFFERNGLRHGEFNLDVDQIQVKGKESDQNRKWGYKVRELTWNSDSNVLAIWIEGEKGDAVQLWTTSNYHWYLKHEIAASLTSDLPGRFTSIHWHPELALHLTLTTTSDIIQRIYSWDTFISHSLPPNDSGIVAVIDGTKLLLTPFRSQNVPPPMSSFQLQISPDVSLQPSLTQIPIYVTSSPENDAMGVLWEDGYVELWNIKARLLPGPGKIIDPSKIWSGIISEIPNMHWRQLTIKFEGSYTITALGTGPGSQKDMVSVTTVIEGSNTSRTAFTLPRRNCRLLFGAVPDTYQGPDGEIFSYSHEKETLFPLARFSEFCVNTYKLVTLPFGEDEPNERPLYVGLAKSGKLYVSNSDEETRTISTNAMSFAIASGFVIFTTNSHEATFAPISRLPKLFEQEEGAAKEVPADWPTRKVERGSRIVVAVPSAMSLVLQMPRGNLETINPRPLVMEVVKQDLDAGNYRKAFFACRKHRIDLNVIVDHSPETLLARISSFVDQIPEVDHLNLFLALIGRGNSTPEFIAKICDAFRDELEKRDLTKYVNSILMAHVVKTPPDYEAGLGLLLRLRDTVDPSIVEDAVKYIIFLVEADKLFDTALGMYDFSLVIMIAQHAQKDPREYLPFLRELRALDQYYQRFRIDDHLKRYEKALKNLSLAGPERFEEAVTYVERHRLYEAALSIWKGSEQYENMLDIYGDWLFERREFRQAATVFVEAKKSEKAMTSYEKALEWRELFDVAQLNSMSEEDTIAMAYRVAEELSSKKRYPEAARVLLDYAQDVREAVIALVQDNAFSEACRIIGFYSLSELLEDIIYPASLETRAQIAEDLGEMKEQIRKQVARLRELRIKKVEEPDAFYGTEDNAALHNVDVMTDVSMAPTAFTRYTVAPTATSRSSSRTSRSKRKMERKVGSGRKGTVDEEEYLLRSVSKLVDRFVVTQGEARALLPHLFRFSESHREEGLELQREVSDFEVELKAALDDIWARPPAEDDGEAIPDGWAARMAEREKNKVINPLDKVPKPGIAQAKDWRMNLFDFK
ncbi:IkappaB kinase complex IKAP component [Gymnopilus junonius]|uniref:Elongator complex protein 1 n=1 Tax=Gymnopilus junonius TaxID=109634 RepID=A0A9P5TT07_GYMJU|nr:IkappaB kinase complex IKAP component [Gymnopilus junonius]